MSDPSATREWKFYVTDMAACAEKIIRYTAGFDPQQFAQSELHYDATLRNLELIGEAASHIPTAVRDAHPQIPWRRIIGMRNKLIHGYLGIDDDIVWSAVTTDIPDLLTALTTLIAAAAVNSAD